MKKIMVRLYVYLKVDGIIDWYYDRMLGIDTKGSYPAPYRQIKNILQSIPVVGKNVCDIGCGQGRFLFMAAKQRANSCMGIDFDLDRIRMAKKNLTTSKVNADIVFRHANAMEFKHYKGFNVFFLGNPFGIEILDECIKHVKASCQLNPIQIIYSYGPNLKGKELMDSQSWLKSKPLFTGCTLYYSLVQSSIA
ncbi:MAG TPA: class I SAM-dependent methyltransferase [Bacteroidia bacterium]|jgi:16S rRNA G966 N2-methylase RsmD|nr:class I SAM-dependent methyltransferase [Bacteroidia bacterium]